MIIKGQKYKLYDIFKLLESFSTEGFLHVKEDGLHVEQASPSNVEFLNLHVHDKIKWQEDDAYYKVNYKDIKNALRSFKKKEDVLLAFSDVVTISSDRKSFTKPIYDDRYEHTDLNEIPFTYENEHDIGGLREVINDCSKVHSDNNGEVRILVSNNALTVKAGTDRDNYKYTMDVDSEASVDVRFTIGLLDNGLKALDQLFSSTTMKLQTHKPVTFQTSNTYATATYIIAPRLNRDT